MVFGAIYDHAVLNLIFLTASAEVKQANTLRTAAIKTHAERHAVQIEHTSSFLKVLSMCK